MSGTPSAFDMDEEDEDEDDFVTIPKEKYDSMIEDLLTMAELIDMVSDMRTKDVPHHSGVWQVHPCLCRL